MQQTTRQPFNYGALRRRVPLLPAVALPPNLIYALSSSNYFSTTPMAALGFALLAIGGPLLGALYLIGAVEPARWERFQGATVAAGRISLTVYVLEGVSAGLICNGYGPALYGSVGALGCFSVSPLPPIWQRIFLRQCGSTDLRRTRSRSFCAGSHAAARALQPEAKNRLSGRQNDPAALASLSKEPH